MSAVNPSDVIERVKHRARRLKKDHPDKGYMQRLDVAARELGFKHYTDLLYASKEAPVKG